MTDVKNYWMPEVLPENDDEYNRNQNQKIYLTPENIQRGHPNWHYDNGAYVDDEYLYQNERWKLVINEPPVGHPGDVEISMNPPEKWIHDEKTVKATYTFRKIVDNRPKIDESIFNIIKNPTYEWETTETERIVTYSVTEKSEKEKEDYIVGRWNEIRRVRNEKLSQCDHYILIAAENEKRLHEDFIKYRQELRDIPNTISSPLKDPEWPVLPTNIFV